MVRISTLASKKRSNQKVVQDSQNKIIQLVVCMYVTLFLKHGNVSQMPFYEKYITISQFYAYREMRMSSSPGIVKFWHLDVHPNCFESVLFWGNVLLSFFFGYLFAEKEHTRSPILCPAHWNLFFCVRWWGIVSYLSYGCTLFYEKINLILRFLRCTCIISLWEGFHIYIHSLTLIVGIFTGIR